jgi:hypothetical protein
MKSFPRALAIAGLAAVMGGASLGAMAQPGGSAHGAGGPGPMMRHMQAARPTDPAEQLSQMREEIGITSAQAAAWDAYAKVVQDAATRMRAGHDKMKRVTFLEMSTQDRLAYLMQRRDEREQSHAAVKAAGDALLAVLTDTQKVRALLSLPGLAPAPFGHGRHAVRAAAGAPMGAPMGAPAGAPAKAPN